MKKASGWASTTWMYAMPKVCRLGITTFSATCSMPRLPAREQNMTDAADRGKPYSRVEVPGAQGVQVGDYNQQVNQFIQTYVESPVVQRPRHVQLGLWWSEMCRRSHRPIRRGKIS